MEIIIVKDPISREKLLKIAKDGFGDLVKTVVDVEQKIIAIGGEMHADEEAILAEKYGSKRDNVWGINLYPEKSDSEWIEFDSMINIKPQNGNLSRGVDDGLIQEKIKQIIKSLIF